MAWRNVVCPNVTPFKSQFLIYSHVWLCHEIRCVSQGPLLLNPLWPCSPDSGLNRPRAHAQAGARARALTNATDILNTRVYLLYTLYVWGGGGGCVPSSGHIYRYPCLYVRSVGLTIANGTHSMYNIICGCGDRECIYTVYIYVYIYNMCDTYGMVKSKPNTD